MALPPVVIELILELAPTLELRMRTQYSLSRLVGLYWTGMALVYAPFALLALLSIRSCHPRVHGVEFWSYTIAMLAIMASGGLLAIKLKGKISEGVRLERWSQEELCRPRRLLEHSAIHTVQWMALIAACILLCTRMIAGNRLPSIYLFLIYIPMWLQSLRHALAEPRPSSTALFRQELAPIHSEHWGGGDFGREANPR